MAANNGIGIRREVRGHYIFASVGSYLATQEECQIIKSLYKYFNLFAEPQELSLDDYIKYQNK